MKYIQIILLAISFGFLSSCGSEDASTPPANIDAPVLEAIGDKSVFPGDTMAFTVRASDRNNDSLSFAATAIGTDPQSLSPVANFSINSDQVSATFTWSPDTSQIGNYVMQFTVTDNSMESLTDSETITISVLDSIAQGRILYRDECGSCHGFEGQAGSEFGIGAPTPAVMTQAFADFGVMNKYVGFYTTAELQMMYDYLCSLPENNLC